VYSKVMKYAPKSIEVLLALLILVTS